MYLDYTVIINLKRTLLCCSEHHALYGAALVFGLSFVIVPNDVLLRSESNFSCTYSLLNIQLLDWVALLRPLSLLFPLYGRMAVGNEWFLFLYLGSHYAINGAAASAHCLSDIIALALWWYLESTVLGCVSDSHPMQHGFAKSPHPQD